jgi:hypothetical protein
MIKKLLTMKLRSTMCASSDLIVRRLRQQAVRVFTDRAY